MPLPIPETNETKDEFIKRFMADKKMIMEYPDEKQRYAIANSQWEGVDRYNAGMDYDDVCLLLSNLRVTVINNLGALSPPNKIKV